MDKKVELFREYMEHLFVGRRFHARQLIFDAHERGFNAEKLLMQIIWPAMEQIEKLFCEDHIPRLVEQMAVRINRMVADQLHAVLNRNPNNGKRLVVVCGEGQIADLGGQILSDLFETEGWIVQFVGPGAPNDELVKFLGKNGPHLLVIYGIQSDELPNVRHLMEMIRDVGVCENMQVLACGGVFNETEDHVEALDIDLFARNAKEAIQVAFENPVRVPRSPLPGRRKPRIKRKRTASAKKDLAFEAASRE